MNRNNTFSKNARAALPKLALQVKRSAYGLTKKTYKQILHAQSPRDNKKGTK